jgi:molecular chaperone DnaK
VTTMSSETAAPSLAPPAGGTATTSTLTVPTSSAPPTLWLYDSGPVPPFHSLISSATNNWTAVDFGMAGARQDLIAVVPDNAGGMRVTWTGGAPAQVYLQNVADARDLTSFVSNGGALVFDTVVHSLPTERTAVAVHCIFPCASEVDASTVFRDLPVGQKTTVKIPITCFTAKGLSAAMVNTPFLVYTTGAFDATFSDIRWEANVPDATPCSDVP